MKLECKDISYSPGKYYKLTHVSGNPYHMEEPQLDLVVSNHRSSFPISVVRQVKQELKKKLHKSKVHLTERVRKVLQDNLPQEVEVIETFENLKYGGQPYSVSDEDIEKWVQNTIDDPNF